MKDLYQFAQDVLGSGENAQFFLTLIEKSGERPETILSNEFATEYLFRQCGIQLCFDKRLGQFSSLVFHFGSVMAKSGDAAQYTGSLPGNVKAGDKPADVEQKLSSSPIKSDIIPGVETDQRWDIYDFNSLEATFVFDEPNWELSSVSLRVPGGL